MRLCSRRGRERPESRGRLKKFDKARGDSIVGNGDGTFLEVSRLALADSDVLHNCLNSACSYDGEHLSYAEVVESSPAVVGTWPRDLHLSVAACTA